MNLTTRAAHRRALRLDGAEGLRVGRAAPGIDEPAVHPESTAFVRGNYITILESYKPPAK